MPDTVSGRGIDSFIMGSSEFGNSATSQVSGCLQAKLAKLNIYSTDSSSLVTRAVRKVNLPG
jgi:hypothetical protein